MVADGRTAGRKALRPTTPLYPLLLPSGHHQRAPAAAGRRPADGAGRPPLPGQRGLGGSSRARRSSRGGAASGRRLGATDAGGQPQQAAAAWESGGGGSSRSQWSSSSSGGGGGGSTDPLGITFQAPTISSRGGGQARPATRAAADLGGRGRRPGVHVSAGRSHRAAVAAAGHTDRDSILRLHRGLRLRPQARPPVPPRLPLHRRSDLPRLWLPRPGLRCVRLRAGGQPAAQPGSRVRAGAVRRGPRRCASTAGAVDGAACAMLQARFAVEAPALPLPFAAAETLQLRTAVTTPAPPSLSACPPSPFSPCSCCCRWSCTY